MLCTSNVFATNKKETNSTKTENPQVCQFSLDHYTGTISDKKTNNVQVRLSCPQKEEVKATVFVYINNELVVSELFTIDANSDRSEYKRIAVPSEYKNGDKYKLTVE